MTWSRQAEPVPLEDSERRAERRFTTEGEVMFAFEDPMRREVLGKLVDISKSGFRALHNCAQLNSGQVVEFDHLLADGQAQVAWNRILPETVETGFVVLEMRAKPLDSPSLRRNQ